MRERVRNAVAELGYQPNFLAQSLRRRTSFGVGLIVNAAGALFTDLVTGAELELRQAGYTLLLANDGGAPSADVELLRMMAHRRLDGVLLSLADERPEQMQRLLTELDLPVVLLDRDLDASVPVGRVLVDHAAGVSAGVGDLLDRGHRRLGLIGGPPLRPQRERWRGIVEAHEARGLKVTCDVETGPWSVEAAEEATRRLLARRRPPEALIAASAVSLVGVLQELRRSGLTVGQDVCVLSLYDSPLTQLSTPAISVVRHETARQGREAARMLIDMINGAQPSTVVLPTEFVKRDSCPCARRQAT